MQLILFFLLIPFYLFSTPLQERMISNELIDELFCEWAIRENKLEETQVKWLRPAQKERWEIDELAVDKKIVVIEWAKRAGLFEEWTPILKHYDKAFILGSTTKSMQERLKYLSKLFDQGITFNEVVFLTSERPLDRRVDDFCDLCKTETEAAKIIWKTADLSQEIRTIPVIFISPPCQGLKRPTTQENIKSWLAQNQTPVTALFVSSQPHAIYQYAVINHTLPESYLFDVVTEKAAPLSAVIILDTLARWIFENEQPQL